MVRDIKKKAKCVAVATMVGFTTGGLLTVAIDDIMFEPPKKQLDINPDAYYTGKPYEILFEPHAHLPGTLSAFATSASTTSDSYDKAAKSILVSL